jgi:hypothetical protein
VARRPAAPATTTRVSVLPNLSPNEPPAARGCGFALQPHGRAELQSDLGDLVAIQATRETAFSR